MSTPEDYHSWRQSLGFTDQEIQILYESIDSVNENEIRVYLQSKESEHYRNIGLASGAFGLACERLIRSGEVRQKVGLMLTVFNTSIIRALDMAMMGRYTEAFVLFRSSIESGMRLCFNVMKVYGTEYFDEFLKNVKWKDDDPNWADALKKEKGLDLGGMARCIDRIGFSKPVRSLYYFFKVNDLNSFTHSNILQIADSESNFLKNMGVIEFDEEKFGLACKLWIRYFEFLLIFMQHTLDKLVPSLEPILIPGHSYPNKLFADYSKLATSTKYRKIEV